MLNLKDVTYKYTQESECSDIEGANIQVNQGECVLLCGRSGSGKSTLSKMINGLIPHYYENGALLGRVSVAGLDTASSEIYEISRVVSSVFQNPKTQFFNVNTTGEILFYLENRGFDQAFMKQKLEECARLFDIDHLLNRDIFELSGGEKQMIALASAYVSGTEIILLDEVSSNLDLEKTALIGEILKKLKELGKTLIIAEHRFSYIKDIIDRVYYIDQGKIKGVFSGADFFRMPEEERKEKGLRSIEFEELERKSAERRPDKKKLTIEFLSHPFDRQNRGIEISGLSFDFGSIVGIHGRNGLGKSTFIKVLMGLEKSKSCNISIDGRRLKPKERLKLSYLVMQDVNYQLFTDSVMTEVTLGMSEAYSEEHVHSVLKALDIDAYAESHPMSLSGGEKQRVAIASAILSGAKIICFDEPTSGMDYENMRKISELIQSTVNDELLIFVISHDNEFLNHCVDETLDMSAYEREF
ncbi:MAG: ABC transporter ATP-binding protein [Bacillota bacterium]|nr:ABC transporter ATP-binding protein [Bacillota bacterium]